MSRILLDRVSFWAHHGYYEEERLLGNRFLVSVSLDLDPEAFSAIDDLECTFDLDRLMALTTAEMRQPARLLEHVGHRIDQRIRDQWPAAFEEGGSCTVTIRKCHPPLGGEVGYSLVDTAGRIGLEGMRLRVANDEGWEELLHASVYVSSDVEKAKEDDDLANTVNYESIYWAINREQGLEAMTLEHRAFRIAQRLRMQHGGLQAVEVELVRAQSGGAARIELYEDLEADCPRCGEATQCYGAAGGACWCKAARIPPAKRALLAANYEGCLCAKCLGEYGITIGS